MKMISNITKNPRGRPSTFNRAHVLDTALMAYWEAGAEHMSVNEICRLCKVSKPALYREFGNEEGLLQAVLFAYQTRIMEPMMAAFTTDEPFYDVLMKCVDGMTSLQAGEDKPKGCLMAKMQAAKAHQRPNIQIQIEEIHAQMLSILETKVKDAQHKKEIVNHFSPSFASAYIDSQFNNASTHIARGVSSAQVKEILTTALSVLINKD